MSAAIHVCRALVGGFVAWMAAAALLAGCGSTQSASSRVADGGSSALPSELVAEARPIGRPVRFHPPAHGPVVGACRRQLGHRSGVHVEVFAENRVVLIAAGIGTRGPRVVAGGRITAARCYGDLVTLEPTGVVLVRAGARLRLADLFRSWGQPLTPRRLGPFSAPARSRVEVFVGGRRRLGWPGGVPLTAHAEIVLEVGPHVPPHRSYTFPPGA